MSNECNKCGNSELDKLAFEKLLIIPDHMYGDHVHYIRCFQLLLQCMKETNKIHEKNCEFFQIRFRPTIPLLERPEGLAFEFRWGNKDE